MGWSQPVPKMRALDLPFLPIGHAHRQGVPLLGNVANGLLDAALEAIIQIGRIHWSDGGSHTINTSGLSSLGWRSNAATFANASTSVLVGLAAVDAANGPPGRAVNVADAITFDVSKTLTGGGGLITSNAWQEHGPDAGTKTIADGDLVAFAVQMVTRGGADAINVGTAGTLSTVSNTLRPGVTGFQGAAYANVTSLPNVILTASDGTIGWFVGGCIQNGNATTVTWNNTSGTKEYGNLLQFPFPTRAHGLIAYPTITGDCDFILYSDPLGTPVAQATVSVDVNTVQLATSGMITANFATPYDIPANTPVGIVMKPTSATNVAHSHLSLNSSTHQVTYGCSGYAINRNTGAFAAQNSSKDRFGMGLLIGAFSDGVGGGAAFGAM